MPTATQERTEVAASVTIKRGDEMTKPGRRRIAKWLRQQADFLEEHGPEFGPTFRARYYVEK